MRSLLTALCALVLGSALGAEAPPKFKKKPIATREGKTVKVEFALEAETDVAVFILDAKGKIVRHLAAGVLGEKAPKPFKAGSLSQSIEWDGKDDAGKAATGGPFKVRVAAGLKAGYAGTSFGSQAKPNDLTNVIGLATAPDGRVYVMSHRYRRAWWVHTAVHVYRRNGAYEKTIKPFAPSIPAKRVEKLTALRDADGRPIPVVYRVLSISYYPSEDTPQQMAITPDGNLHFAVIRAAYRKGPGKWLASIGPDGGQAYETYTGGQLPSDTSAGDVCLVSTTDGKAVFATGLERGPGKSSATRPNTPVVWKIDLPARKEAKPFFGDKKEVGAGETGLKDPRGLAVDGKGRLYVADRGNNRVVILGEKDAKFAGSFQVPAPLWVGAHRKSGAVYVASPGTLIKFAVGKDGKAVEKSRVALPALDKRYAARAKWSFALDAEAEPAVLWVGVSAGGAALHRCQEKKDGTLGDLEKPGYRPARSYWNIAVGFDRKTVACKAGHYGLRILDEDTGKTRDLRLSGSAGQTYRLGPKGQIYGIDHWKWGVRRWTKDGKSLPFPETKNHPEAGGKGRLGNKPSGTTSWERDFDVDRAGNVYVKHRGKVYHGRMRVDKYDKDGKFLGTLVWVVTDGALGPRVDPAGNIYIADSIRPVGKHCPDFFKGKLPKVKINKRGSPLQQYRWMYGSIIKFSPKGGSIWFPIINPKHDVYAFDGEAELPAGLKKVKVDTSQGDRVAVKAGELQGALWYRYGCAYILDMHPGHNRRCHCVSTEFEVDDFGRTFYTDQGRFRVVVLDTGGNEIVAFGGYGNQDYCGPDSYVLDPKGKFLRPRKKDDLKDLVSPFAKPAIAFNWFVGLGVSDRYAYVADGGNRRVVRVRLDYAADETVAVK